LLERPAALSGLVLDEAGEPVIGALLRVVRRTRNRGRVTWLPYGNTATTDDRGMYRAGNLAPGEYAVMVEQTNVNLPTAIIEAYQNAQNTLKPGETNPFSDELFTAGGFGLTPGTSNSRLVNAQVQSLARGSTQSPLNTAGANFVYATTYFPGSLNASNATAISLRSGEDRTGIDIVLRPVRAISISGTVSSPDGPIGLTAVTLTRTDGVESAFDSGRIGTTTNATGAFTFLGVPAGDYKLRVTKIPSVRMASNMVTNQITLADGSTSFMASSSGPARVPPLPPDSTFWAEQAISAGTRDIAGVTLVLAPGARLSGRVEFTGALAQPTAQQLSGLTFSLRSIRGTEAAFRTPRTRIDEQGRVTTQGFPAGLYSVAVFGVPPGWSLASVTSKGVDVSQHALEIGANDISDLVISFTDAPTELTGSVTTQDAAPPKGAAVFLFPSDEPLVGDAPFNSRRILGTRASANGRYSFKGFPPGNYRVVAIDNVSTLDDLSGELVQSLVPRATSLRFTAGDKRQQDLVVGGSK